MVRHRRRNHLDHEPVTQRSRLGLRRQARRTPLPSGHIQEVVEPREGAPVWSVVSAPVPSALSGQRPRGSASRDRSRGMVCNRQHRQRASCQQHPIHPDGNREMSIVVVKQAISTKAHTGVLRSCGEVYNNHPAVAAGNNSEGDASVHLRTGKPSWPCMPGVPAAGHVTAQGLWHPGRPENCRKCPPPTQRRL